MERVSGLEGRIMAVDQLQDALEQRVELLSDQRETLPADSQQGKGHRRQELQDQQLSGTAVKATGIQDIQLGARGGFGTDPPPPPTRSFSWIWSSP